MIGIELAQAAGGRVPRIGEELLARRRLPLVDGGEIRVGQVDLSAHLQNIGNIFALKLLRNVVDSPGIGRHILADSTIAARGGSDEPTLLVAKAERQAVDLGFGGEEQRLDPALICRKRRMRSTNSSTSSSAKALARDSIGTRCWTLLNFSEAFERQLSGSGSRRISAPGSGLPTPRSDVARRRILRPKRSARPARNSAGHAAAISSPSAIMLRARGLDRRQVIDGVGETVICCGMIESKTKWSEP